MPPHKLNDRKGYAGLLPDIMPDASGRPPLGRMSRGEMLNNLLKSPLLAFIESTGPVLRNLSKEGVDRDILRSALLQLCDLEKLRPGERRKNLREVCRCAVNLKRALTRTFRAGEDSHTAMIRALETYVAQIRPILKPWDEREGKWGRSPETRILVALMAYVRHATKGGRHYKELSALALAAYKLAGSSRKDCAAGSLARLWRRNRDLHEDWQSVLKEAQKLHRRVQVLRPRSGPERPKTSKTPKLRASGRLNYVN